MLLTNQFNQKSTFCKSLIHVLLLNPLFYDLSNIVAMIVEQYIMPHIPNYHCGLWSRGRLFLKVDSHERIYQFVLTRLNHQVRSLQQIKLLWKNVHGHQDRRGGRCPHSTFVNVLVFLKILCKLLFCSVSRACLPISEFWKY